MRASKPVTQDLNRGQGDRGWIHASDRKPLCKTEPPFAAVRCVTRSLANARHRLVARLLGKSNAQLAALGIKRADIVNADIVNTVFRDFF